MVGSATRIGPAVRSRLFGWSPHRSLVDRTVAITGATSGLGRELAVEAASLGAHVVVLVRDVVRGEELCERLRTEAKATATCIHLNLADLVSVRAAADALQRVEGLDALVHNAGALSNRRSVTPQGFEQTYAVHVLGPFLLTCLVLEHLERSVDPRVVVTTSAGMYTEPLAVDLLEMPAAGYRGSVAYARCKRAQVSLVDALAPSLRARGVLLCAFHPGWADTEGVRTSLPRFHRTLRPLLRSPAQGVDTALWLLGAARGEIGEASLFSDRAPRVLHRLASTTRSDTFEERARLVAKCRRDAGHGPAGGHT